jgi:uncharacterized protein YndB with AHSA1/START domain
MARRDPQAAVVALRQTSGSGPDADWRSRPLIRKYTIVRQITVPAPIEDCWRALNDADRISLWFADVTGVVSPGCTFEFHFGDGDFFRGGVHEADPPVGLRFWWKFMGLGSRSEIEYALLPLADNKTLVSVVDHGEHSTAGAQEIGEGWDDFLARLERSIRTGDNCRYRWTESISCTAVVPWTVQDVRVRLIRPAEWSGFPDASVSIEEAGTELAVTMSTPAWSGLTTTATLSFREVVEGAQLSVVHRGFDRLHEDVQLRERKRYAGYWAALLAQLETPYTCWANSTSTPDQHDIASFLRP